jgi:hypothetical protein
MSKAGEFQNITPLARFKSLGKAYRAAATLPLTRERKHNILWAASLQQCLEMGLVKRATGRLHDRRQLEDMKVEIKARLASAGIAHPMGRTTP